MSNTPPDYVAPMTEKTTQPQPQAQHSASVPLSSLMSNPAPVDCPHCRQRTMTRTETHSGGVTHAWALGVCCLIGLGCIPYCIDSTKDVWHSCGNCGVQLAQWHRSGRCEVRAYA